MNKYILQILLCALCMSLLSCMRLNSQNKAKNIAGIRGRIFEKKGNQMPMKGQTSSNGLPLSTAVYIFEPTTIDQTAGLNGSICSNVLSRLVDSVISDSKGKYFIALKPGKYTMLVKYDKGYFVPFFSGFNELAIIEIKPKLVSELDIIVNEQASY